MEEVQVLVDPHRLAARGLALSDVAAALGKANVLNVVGRMQDHSKLLLLALDNTARGVEQVRGTVMPGTPGGLVRVGDVAEVSRGVAPQWTRISEDGQPAVQFQVYQQPDGNTIAIAAAVRQALAAYQPQLPAGVTLANWYDQSTLVTDSAGSVRDAILIGLGLAGLVLLAFLRSLRVTLVAMLVVPANLATTVLLLLSLGMTFNIMTLGGIAAAVGLVIDDVITMVEHLARRAGASDAAGSGDAVLAAGREFLPPLTGSSMATLLVFFPLAFLSGVTGAFFKALSLTMAAALVISYGLTALAVPVLTRFMVDFRRWKDPGHGPEGRVSRAHRWLLEGLFARPWLLAPGLVPLLLLGWFASSHVGSGFMPKMDEGGFVLDFRSAPGTSLSETTRELAQVEAILHATPEVATFSTRVGAGLNGGLSEPNRGDFLVRLKTGPRRPIETVMADVQDQIDAAVPGRLHVATAQLMEDLIGDLTAVPQPIEVKLYANDPAALAPAARKLAATIGKVQGVVSVQDGIVIAGDGLSIQVDPARAAIEGVDAQFVSDALQSYLGGTVATQMPQATKLVGVRVWLPPGQRQFDDQLADLPIRAPDGHVFALSRVAEISAAPGQAEITRESLQPMIPITARLQGASLGTAVADVKTVLDQPGMLPPGVRYELGGLYGQWQGFRPRVHTRAAAPWREGCSRGSSSKGSGAGGLLKSYPACWRSRSARPSRNGAFVWSSSRATRRCTRPPTCRLRRCRVCSAAANCGPARGGDHPVGRAAEREQARDPAVRRRVRGGHDALMQAAEALKALIAHAVRGKEHVEWAHPYDVGMTGLIGFSSGYHAMSACDALLMLGTDFPYRQFYPKGVRIAQVDIRPETIRRRTPIKLGLLGDGALGFWKALDTMLPATRHQRCTVGLLKNPAVRHSIPICGVMEWHRATEFPFQPPAAFFNSPTMHKTVNIVGKLPKSVQPAAKADLREVWAAPDRATTETAIMRFVEK